MSIRIVLADSIAPTPVRDSGLVRIGTCRIRRGELISKVRWA